MSNEEIKHLLEDSNKLPLVSMKQMLEQAQLLEEDNALVEADEAILAMQERKVDLEMDFIQQERDLLFEEIDDSAEANNAPVEKAACGRSGVITPYLTGQRGLGVQWRCSWR